MVREISAGGVVIRSMRRNCWVAVIEPRRDNAKSGTSKRKTMDGVLALPKGLVDAGEQAEQTAVREVREETGVTASPIAKLTDIKYFYVRSWGDGERVFKIVSFYLLRFGRGRIGEIAENMRHEVVRAFWMPLAEAANKLSYKGEKQAAKLALDYLAAHPELLTSKAAARTTPP
jgi:8-oxo-dGTP pyrophosphatase MutT (NUDIX family)